MLKGFNIKVLVIMKHWILNKLFPPRRLQNLHNGGFYKQSRVKTVRAVGLSSCRGFTYGNLTYT